LSIFQLNAKSGKRYCLRCLVHVEIHDFGRSPSIRNRPNFSSDKFLNNVASTKNCTGQVECTFTVPDSSCSMIVWSGASSSQWFNGWGKSVSRSVIARNFRHIHLNIKPILNSNLRRSWSCNKVQSEFV
jgi:hypothetical protein